MPINMPTCLHAYTQQYVHNVYHVIHQYITL